MAVLPWGHSRNNTSSSTERSKASSQNWFSRSTAEPSRQAINQLMKQQHTRGGSGGAVSVRSLSRAGTPSSQHSSHRSVVSVDTKSERMAGVVFENSSRSSSRPATPVRPATSRLESSDSVTKSLFQKGGLLRRKGSKISMNSPANPVDSKVSPSQPSSRAGLRGRDVTASPTRDDSRKTSISKPFDFAHVMHGDINLFTGLGRIDESDLASQFDAIQARYRTTMETGESISQEPELLTPTEKTEHIQTPTPTPSTPVITPTTPPPAPPPKDSPRAVSTKAAEVRVSRSTENFSRPTPRSPTTSGAASSKRPSSCHLQHLMSRSPVIETTDSTPAKPLPQLPIVGHAVSTEDDTARLLMSAPLPSPPANPERSGPRHHRQSSSRSSLRHMSSFPSTRHPQTASSIQDGQLLGIKEEDLLPRPRSDYELSKHKHRHQSINRDSEPLHAEDWEVAIDSAWDFEDDDDDDDIRVVDEMSRERRESSLTIDQPRVDNASSPSTPLMTMAPSKPARQAPSTHTTLSTTEVEDNKQNTKSALFGLGIEADEKAETSSRASRLPALEVVTSDTSRINISPRLARSAYSALSHSSSQESIILSIASSIISTQRSSMSSVGVSEHTQPTKADRSSIPVSATSPLLNIPTQKPARPESSCLPSALLQQMNFGVQKAARPDSMCLPSVTTSKRNSALSVMSKPERPESVCLPQDMLATFPIPETSSSSMNSAGQSSTSENEDDQVTDLPSNDSKKRPASIVHNSVSNRMSSSSSVDSVHATRRRSSTQGSRPRNVRVSYSLFPTAPASATSASLLPENESVAV